MNVFDGKRGGSVLIQRHLTAIIAAVAVLATAGALWWTSRAAAPRTSTWADVVEEAARGGYRLITTEELAAAYRRDPAANLLVDTRQEWEYRAGHIAGAVNFPIEPTGWARWRKADGLRKLLGPDRHRNIVFY